MKKATSILLALFFLMSTSHLSFATHYCGGKALKHAILFDTNNLVCEMENQEACCDESPAEIKDNCCNNEFIQYSLKDNFQKETQNTSKHQNYSTLLVAFNLLFDIEDNKISSIHQAYKPPLPNTDIQLLVQSFLI